MYPPPPWGEYMQPTAFSFAASWLHGVMEASSQVWQVSRKPFIETSIPTQMGEQRGTSCGRAGMGRPKTGLGLF
jgi:hypothetical protein